MLYPLSQSLLLAALALLALWLGRRRLAGCTLLLAVGWSRTRVLTSVLVEGLLLSLIGGLVGVAFGYAEVQAARHWFSMDALSGTLNLTRSWQAVGLAFGIGFLASLYPAIRASMLQPIDALRHE